MTRLLTALAFALLAFLPLRAQELNCTVQIEFSKTQTTDSRVFETLQAAITEFMNNTKWTNDAYEPHERVDCSILINIDEEISSNEFGGQFLIQSERPVYNSSYKTVVFSWKDDNFRFEYNEFDNLNFSDNTYFSNLTSILAYYAYIILGFDYDSFSPDGGTAFYLKAQDVVNSIPGGEKARWGGWDPFGGIRNRAILVNHLTNPRYGEFRELLLQWHYQGLDIMYSDPVKGRRVLAEGIDLLRQVFDDNPNTMLVKIFFLAKSEEIINVFSAGSSSEKNDIIEKVSNMDPVNATKYETIRKL